MKTFLAVYVGDQKSRSHQEWQALSAPEKKKREEAGLQAWYAWGEKHKAAIVDNGAPLGKTKLMSSAGMTDIRNNMAGYTIVRAESHEAAARMFENHPHFAIFPGTGVEVMECLPIPGGS